MLKEFRVKNFMNFRDELRIDFSNIGGYQFNENCICNGLISKMLLYGRNASGKTNLGLAFMDAPSMFTGKKPLHPATTFLNADSNEDTAEFYYLFQLDAGEAVYHYAKESWDSLRSEELTINGQLVFSVNYTEKAFSRVDYDFLNTDEETAVRFFSLVYESDDTGHMPFLRWLSANVGIDPDSALIGLTSALSGAYMMGLRHRVNLSEWTQNMSRFFESLAAPNALQEFESFLNAMGVECKLVLKILPDGKHQLYFAHEHLLPFTENMSSGTQALTNLYRGLILREKVPTLIYLDEFDAFYHYEMAETLVRFLRDRYPKAQVILTSHNTGLITNRLSRPDCVFILSRSGKLTALRNATERELREGHNLEKMYISGEFEHYE